MITMPRYRTRGTDQESGNSVRVEIGWAKGTGYFFGVDTEDGHELASGVELDLVDLIDRTRGYLAWNRQLLYAMRDAPLAHILRQAPEHPVSKIVQSIR
jgi:hypothetical protein